MAIDSTSWWRGSATAHLRRSGRGIRGAPTSQVPRGMDAPRLHLLHITNPVDAPCVPPSSLPAPLIFLLSSGRPPFAWLVRESLVAAALLIPLASRTHDHDDCRTR